MVATSLAFHILATDDGASKVLSTIGTHAGKTEEKLNLLGKGTKRFSETTREAFKFAAAGVLGAGLIEGLKSVWEEAEHSQLVMKQTEAVLRSTGGVAHITAGQVGDLASSLSEKTAVDDEAIQSGANVLLTFTKVRNEVGQGNDIFNQATAATLDMTAAMNGGVVTQEALSATSIRVGRALNDPIAGMTALTRSGVTFTAAQKDQVKVMVESGDILGAQKLILKELAGEFGGSAAAAATGAKRLSIVISNVKEDIGKGLVKVVDEAGDAIADKLPAALAAGSRAFGLIEGPIQRIGHSLLDILVPTLHNAAEAVKPLALLVGGGLVAGLHLLADVLGFIDQHKAVFLPLAAGVLAFVAASKGIALVQTLIRTVSGLLETAALKAMYAGTAMKAFAVGESAVAIGAVALNAALGIAAIAIGLLVSRHMKAKQAQEEHSSAVTTFSQVLRDNKGAINENVVAQRAQELQQKGLLDLAKKAGLDLNTYTDATLGNAAAQQSLSQGLKDAARSGVLTVDEFGKLTQGTSEYVSITADGKVAIGNLAEAEGKAAGGADKHKAAASAAALALDAERRKADDLWNSLHRIADTSLDAMQSQIEMANAIHAVDGSLKDLDKNTRTQTRSLGLNTQAGRDARSALIQHLKAAEADGAAVREQTGSVAKGTAKTQADVQALRAHYLALGYNKDQIDAIITSMGVLGTKHAKPKITVETGAASKVISQVKRDLDSIRNHTVTLTGRYVSDTSLWRPPPNGPALAALASRGGEVVGGIPGVDSVPLLAMPGERVLTVEENRQYMRQRGIGGVSGGQGAPSGGGLRIGTLNVSVVGATGRDAALELVSTLRELARSGHSIPGLS